LPILTKYGAYTNIDDAFFATQNRETQCFAMIETAPALRDCEAIAALAAVDGLFVGPSDLSVARGRGSFKFSRGDIEDFTAVASAAKTAGKVFGLPAPGAKAFALAVELGASFATVCDDITALRVGLEKGLETARSYEARSGESQSPPDI
ncbi:MAG: aldolase/citrate lyase family protein, partial [Parvibaculaceae bacterium]